MANLRTPPLAKLAVLAVTLALSGVATAATSATTTNAAPVNASQAASDGPGAKAVQEVAMWVPGFGPVDQKTVSALALNAEQAKLLADAQAAQDGFQKSVHDLQQTARDKQKTALDAGKIDPHAAKNAADEMWKKEMSSRRDQLTNKWLALWDALDDAQQQKVTAYLKQRADAPK